MEQNEENQVVASSENTDAIPESESVEEREQSETPSTPEVNDEKVPDGVQKRINKLTAEKYQLRAEIEALKQSPQSLSSTGHGVAPSSQDGPPTLEEYDYDDNAYQNALIDYKVNQAIAGFKTNQQEADTQRKRQETARNFSRKIAEAAIPDYYEVVEKMNNVVLFSPETIEVMQELQNGPQVVHYLGNHLDIADKISGLGPLQAAAELGRISARLGDSPSKNKQTTKAPPPVEPVAGGAGSLSKSYEEMSMSEIMADDRI